MLSQQSAAWVTITAAVSTLPDPLPIRVVTHIIIQEIITKKPTTLSRSKIRAYLRVHYLLEVKPLAWSFYMPRIRSCPPEPASLPQ